MGRTVYAVGGDELHGVLNVAARLEGATVGVNVHVTHGSLDADAEVRRASGVCVQDVHKGGIVRWQTPRTVCILKAGARRVQTWKNRRKLNFIALYSYCVTHLCLFRFYEGIFGLTNIWQSFLWDRNKEFEWSRISCLHAYNKRLPTCDSVNFVVGEVSCDAGHMCTETVA